MIKFIYFSIYVVIFYLLIDNFDHLIDALNFLIDSFDLLIYFDRSFNKNYIRNQSTLLKRDRKLHRNRDRRLDCQRGIRFVL